MNHLIPKFVTVCNTNCHFNYCDRHEELNSSSSVKCTITSMHFLSFMQYVVTVFGYTGTRSNIVFNLSAWLSRDELFVFVN